MAAYSMKTIVLLTLASTVLSQFPHGSMPQYPLMQMPMANGPVAPNMPQMPGMNVPHGMMPMGMPHMPFQNNRLPVAVMPQHHNHNTRVSYKNRREKKRSRKHKHSSSSSEEDSCSDESGPRRRNALRRSNSKPKGRQVLIPVISYITKDGYVVYQKKIKKERAKEWMELANSKASDEMKSRKKS